MSKFVWTDRAKQELRQIEREQAMSILRALTNYAGSGKGRVKRLKGSGDLRLRIGDYRLRFEVIDEDSYRILRVTNRREAYRG
ncbi:MAG: type II toxin-antitoxin system RelE family toxin [Bryobacteraceae bacterium]